MTITKIDCSTKSAGTDTAAVKTHLTINWEGMEQATMLKTQCKVLDNGGK